MITSYTDLANQALHSINAGSISNIDATDRTPSICKKYMDLAILQAISEGEYSITLKRSDLTLNSNTTPEFNYCYNLPGDYVKGRELESGTEYEIEGGVLYTNDDAARLIYWANLPQLISYNPFIVNVMALTLATMICMELKGDSKTLSNALQELALFTKRAKAHDRSERNGKKGNPSTWSDFNTGTIQ